MKNILAIALVSSLSMSAHAAVIDFEDLGVAAGANLHPLDNTMVSSGGYDFINGPNSDIMDLHIGNNSSNTIGSTTEMLSHGDLIMTNSNSSLFNLTSFDFGSIFSEAPLNFWVDGTLAGGANVTQFFVMDGNVNTFQTFLLNSAFSGLESVNWRYEGGNTAAFNIDNINVDTGSVSSVPVPAAVWLMGSGLLGLMGFSRKAKKLAA